jgi:subtilase family serine protease
MRKNLLAIGAFLLVVLTMSFSQTNHAATAMQVRTLGAAEQNAVTHFTVYLPLTNRAALDQLLSDQTDSTSSRYHQWLPRRSSKHSSDQADQMWPK